MTAPHILSRPADLRRTTWRLCLLLAAGALGVSAYLSYISLTAGQAPAGCGSGSGCAQVLASKWSRFMGVPVSLLAVCVYACLVVALVAMRRGGLKARTITGLVISFCTASIVGSAVWFAYLQLFELNAVCPYCMAGHGLGLALAVLLLWRGRARRLAAWALGLLGVGVLVVVQLNTADVVVTLGGAASGQDTDTSSGGQRTVTMLEGELVLNFDDEPWLGSAESPWVLAAMFDYACPHCRHTHGVLQEVREAYPDRVAIVALPTPLNRGCNPHAPEAMSARFEESCELARIGLAVFFADRSAFEGFDRWMFVPETPRTAAQARDEAIRRVGRDKFEQRYSDPRTKQKLARNVYAYGRSGADRVPVVVVHPSNGVSAIVGRVDGPTTVIDLLGITAGDDPR